mgnify:CR=1 FL=1
MQAPLCGGLEHGTARGGEESRRSGAVVQKVTGFIQLSAEMPDG